MWPVSVCTQADETEKKKFQFNCLSWKASEVMTVKCTKVTQMSVAFSKQKQNYYTKFLQFFFNIDRVPYFRYLTKSMVAQKAERVIQDHKEQRDSDSVKSLCENKGKCFVAKMKNQLKGSYYKDSWVLHLLWSTTFTIETLNLFTIELHRIILCSNLEPAINRSGTTSEVGGMISASSKKNTVKDSKMEMERLTWKNLKKNTIRKLFKFDLI